MKKFLITTVLFMLALTVVANDLLYKILADEPIDIMIGIEKKAEYNPFDFSSYAAPMAPANIKLQHATMEPVEKLGVWYSYDFAKDPFDGNIELFVIGEPLPSPITTLLVAFGTLGIILMNKNNKWSKQEKTL